MQLLIYSWTELYAKVQEHRAVAKISGRWHCWFPRNNLLLFLRILIKIVAKCSLCHALDICMRGIVYFNKNSKRSSSANYCFRCTRGAKGAKGHTKRKTTNDFCKKPGDWKICRQKWEICAGGDIFLWQEPQSLSPCLLRVINQSRVCPARKTKQCIQGPWWASENNYEGSGLLDFIRKCH